jgi:putative spermidine/putrescine transport system permease protein
MPLLTACYLLYLAMPVALLVVGSFGGNWTNSLLPTGVTGRWYAEIAADGSFRRAFTTSLIVCAATCAVAALIGVPAAYGIHRAAQRKVRVAMRVLALLPVAAPPLVLGFGFILVFSSEAVPWLGSLWLLVAGQVMLTLPYIMQTVAADLRHLGIDQLESAAESLGAGFRERFVSIVLPSLRQSLVAGLVLVATRVIGEFQFANLVAGFLHRPYPVVLLQAFYGATGFACAGTVVLLALAMLGGFGSTLAGRAAA